MSKPPAQESPLRLSQRLLIVVMICLGFAPWSVAWFIAGLADLDALMRWEQVYSNEEAAWSAIFTVFHIAALVLCIRGRKKAPAFCTVAGSVALLGTVWGLEAISEIGQISSKMDDPQLELWDYWLSGGWLAVLFVAPFVIAYLAVAIFEKRRRRKCP